MSNEAINWAFAQVAQSSQKFILVAMANLADGENTCWPSCEYLSNATGQNIKTVRANIRRLCELGYLIKTGQRRGSTGQVAVYQLNTTKTGSLSEDVKTAKSGSLDEDKDYQKRSQRLPKVEVLQASERLPILDLKTTKNGLKDYQKRSQRLPNLGSRTLNTPKEPVLKIIDPLDDLLKDVDQQVLQDWKTLRKQKKAPITKTAVEGICREAEKAGMSTNEVLALCCSRGWIGFNASWVQGKSTAGSSPSVLGKTGQATAANALRWLEKAKQKEATDAGV